MLPEQSLLICTSPRSGSNWLCDLIGRTGEFGRPDEYFSISSERFYERQLGRGSIQRFPIVFDYILRMGSTANRRFSSKVFWTQLEELETYFHRCGEFVGWDGLSILQDQLPRLRVLRLGRADRLRQAISHYRALRTNIWWKHKDIPVPRPEDCSFDYERIRDLLLMLESWEASWEARLRSFDVPQLTVDYYEMCTDLPRVLRDVCAFLNIKNDRELWSGDSGFSVQADALTDEWVQKFLDCDGGRTGEKLGRDLKTEYAPTPPLASRSTEAAE